MIRKLLFFLAFMMISRASESTRSEQINRLDGDIEASELLLEDGQKVILPARYVALSETLKTNQSGVLHESNTEVTHLPINSSIWQVIEAQLERVSNNIQYENTAEAAILDDFCKLPSSNFIDLCRTIEYLKIPLLQKIVRDVAEDRHKTNELLQLPCYMRNEIIMRKAPKFAVPVCLKELGWAQNHKVAVLSLCTTSDNKIVSGCDDGTVRIGDVLGNELRVFLGHEASVFSVCMTPDNKIVSGSLDKTVRIWDMLGNALAVCRGHEDAVLSVVISSDNKIVSGSRDGTMRIWDMLGNLLAICRHEGAVSSVCVTSDNKIVSGSWDKKVRFWDMSGNELIACKGHEDEVNSVGMTFDNRVVSGSDDGTVRIWDLEGRQLACRKFEGTVTLVYVTPDNSILSVLEGRKLKIWDKLDNLFEGFLGHDDSEDVSSLCMTQDNMIVAGFHDGMICVCNGTFPYLDMNEKQAKLFDRVIEKNRRLLADLEADFKKGQGSFLEAMNKIVNLEDYEDFVKEEFELKTAQMYRQVISKWSSPQIENAINDEQHRDDADKSMSNEASQMPQLLDNLGWLKSVTPPTMIVSGSSVEMAYERTVNCVANLNNNQITLLDELLRKSNELLFLLEQGFTEMKKYVITEILDNISEEEHNDYVEEKFFEITSNICRNVISNRCWQKIEEILSNGQEQPDKRKEVENGKNSPAKKVRLSEEIIAEPHNHE